MILMTLLGIIAIIAGATILLAVEHNQNQKLKAELKALKGSVVEIHDKLPASYGTDGYRYIGMRFQNEIKPFIDIDEERQRITLKVVKPSEK